MNNWWTRRRREKELAERFKQIYELREFVYLDEVSVTSLLSSREGAIPHEFTDSTGSSSKGEVSAQVNASAGVFKGQIGSRYESARSIDSQVVSKATIQTLFKHLYQIEQDKMTLRPIPPSEPSLQQEQIFELLAAETIDTSKQRWVIPTTSLKRGELAEIEVELETDDIFQLSTVVSTFKEVTEEHQGIRAQIDPAVLDEVLEINTVIEKLMAGLIPLKCRIVDYSVINTSTEAKLVHRQCVGRLEPSSNLQVRPLYLVGDTEQNLFWKDIRRILFSGSRFRILCRLDKDGVNSSWNPVKLARILDKLDPAFSEKLSMFGSGAITAMSMTSTSTNLQAANKQSAVLRTYGELLARQAGYTLSEDEKVTLMQSTGNQPGKPSSMLELRKQFASVQEWIEARVANSIQSDVAARLREEANKIHSLLPDGTPMRPQLAPVLDSQQPTRNDLLEVEIIAIYW